MQMGCKYLGISDVHLKDKLRISKEEAMKRCRNGRVCKSHGLKIRFTVEDVVEQSQNFY